MSKTKNLSNFFLEAKIMADGKFERIGGSAFFLVDTSNYQTTLSQYDEKMANLTILYQWEKPRVIENPKHPPKTKELIAS
jgi:hypothetical protein